MKMTPRKKTRVRTRETEKRTQRAIEMIVSANVICATDDRA